MFDRFAYRHASPILAAILLFTFGSVEDKDTYLNHPSRQAFRNLALPYIERLLVVDFWAQE